MPRDISQPLTAIDEWPSLIKMARGLEYRILLGDQYFRLHWPDNARLLHIIYSSYYKLQNTDRKQLKRQNVARVSDISRLAKITSSPNSLMANLAATISQVFMAMSSSSRVLKSESSTP
jgi:hypothetical protein